MNKRILFGLLFGISLALLGYYRYNSIKEKDFYYSAIKYNVEALAEDDETGKGRYPKREGKAQFCTLYVYKKAELTISVGTEPNPTLDANGEYTKEVKRGLEDRCPDKGAGCNPFSCQEVPY